MAAIKPINEDTKVDLSSYATNEMHSVAQDYVDTINAIKQESQGAYDMVRDPSAVLRDSMYREELKAAFREGSYDASDPQYKNTAVLENHLSNMDAIFDNDTAHIMNESSPLGVYNPVVGMTLPMHKNILMNAVFDQVMPKDVARSPKFTLTMETRTLVDTKGNEYDMFYEQNKIKDAVDESIPTADFVWVDDGTSNYVTTTIGGRGAATGDLIHDAFTEQQVSAMNMPLTALSMKTFVSKILIKGLAVAGSKYIDDVEAAKTDLAGHIKVAEQDVKDATLIFDVEGKFTPGYGSNDRIFNRRFMLEVPVERNAVTNKVTKTTVRLNVMGTMEKNKISLRAFKPESFDSTIQPAGGWKAIGDGETGSLQGAVIHAVVDVSNAVFPTVKFKWSATTSFYEIPEAPHLTTEITPEEVKDLQATYDVNQVTKLMSMMRLALLHWKDDSILKDLDDDFLAMPANQKVSGAFDFAPPLNYNNNPVEWRKIMFMDNLDQYVTRMLQVLNDENMTIAIFGRPDIIRRIAPQQYTYQSPSNIGPVELDFKRTVVTSEKRVYNFISSQKMRNSNNLIVLLIPRNSMRITYKVIDYQMYVSNEIRDTTHYQVPAMTCFERWFFLKYQPVQGRIRILNASGLRENAYMKNEEDYLIKGAMNDDTANTEQYASEVNGVIDPEDGHMKLPPVTTTQP